MQRLLIGIVLFLVACAPSQTEQSTTVQNPQIGKVITNNGREITYIESGGNEIRVAYIGCFRSSTTSTTRVSCDISFWSVKGDREIILSPNFVSLSFKNGIRKVSTIMRSAGDNFTKPTLIKISSSSEKAIFFEFEIEKDMNFAESLNIEERVVGVMFNNIKIAL
jgi:hypothetical protein